MKVHYLFNSPRYVFVGLFCILLSQMAKAQVPLYGTITGGNAISVKVPGNFGGNYYTGHSFIFLAVGSVTSGPVTISVNGATPVGLKKNVNQDLVAGDIADKQAIPVIYDGVNFQVLNLGIASTSTGAGTGNLHAFRAKVTLNQTVLPSPPGYTILFDTKEYDTDNNYNVLTGSFKCTEDGYYHFDAYARFQSGQYPMHIQFQLNGVDQEAGSISTDNSWSGASGNYKLNIGDSLVVKIVNYTGSNQSFWISPASQTFFSGFKINGGGTLTVTSFTGSTASGISTLNGLTSTSQNFTYSTTGSSVNIVSSGSTHNFNIPIVTVVGGNNITVTGSFPLYTVSGLANTASSQWSNGGGGIYYSSGGVGIGSTPYSGDGLSVIAGMGPGNPNLQIGQATAIDGQPNAALSFVGFGIANAGFSYTPSSTSNLGSLQLSFGSDNNPAFNTSSFTFTNASKLGIGLGNTLPAASLDVAGDAKLVGPLTITNFAGFGTQALGVNNLGQIVTIPSSIGASISSLNGLTSTSQNFTYSTNGTSVNIVSSGSTHNFNIPLASVVGGNNITVTGSFPLYTVSGLASTATSQWVSTTGGSIFYNGGNIGMGTASPAANLEIVSNNPAGSSMVLMNTNTTTGNVGLELRSAANSGVLQYIDFTSGSVNESVPDFTFRMNASSNGFGINTPSANAFFILNSNANVGIGTYTPAATLDVNGNARFVGPVTISSFAGSGTQVLGVNNLGQLVTIPGSSSAISSINGLTTSSQNFSTSSTGSSINITSSGSTHNFNIPLASVVGGNNITVTGSFPLYTVSGLASTATSQWVSTTGGTIFYNGGNVGIGTNIPSSPLVVSTSTSSGGVLKLENIHGNAGDTWWMGFVHTGLGYLGSDDANDRARIGVTIKTGGYGNLFFTTGLQGAQQEQMRIDEFGNVGIGTSTPSQLLDVSNGNAIIRGFGNFTGPGLAATMYLGDLNNYISSQTYQGVIIKSFGTSAGIALQYITGNVGIDNLSPAAKLDVNGDARFVGPVSISGLATGGSTQAVGVNSLGQLVTIPGSTSTTQWVSTTGGIYYNGGIIGIGNILPTTDFGVRNSNPYPQISVGADNSNYIGFSWDAFNKRGLIQTYANNAPIIVGANWSIFSSTGLGINTLTPGAQLDVNGNTRLAGPVTITSFAGNGIQPLGVNNNGQLVTIPGASLTSISSLNNLTTSSQTFSTSSTGSSINITSSGATHNFNIPLASVVGGNNITVTGSFPLYTVSGLASTATSQWVSTTDGVNNTIFYNSFGLEKVFIGTPYANPFYKFTLTGNNQPYLQSLESYSSTSSGATLNFLRARGTVNTFTPVLSGDELGYIPFTGSTSTNTFNAGASIRVAADGNFSSTSSPGSIEFNTAPVGSLVLSSRLMIKNNGKIGIGNNNPSAFFDVNGNARFVGPVSISGMATGGTTQALGIDLNGQLVTIPGASLTAISSLNNLTTSSQTFSTSSTGSSINITSSGATHNFNIPLVTVVGGNNVTVSGGFPNYTISGAGIPSTATTQWVSTTGGNIFYNGGNVGINTNSPLYTLDVNGSSRINGTLSVAGIGTLGGVNIRNLIGPGTVTVDGLGNLGVSTATSNLNNLWSVVGTSLTPTNSSYGVNIGTSSGSSLVNIYSNTSPGLSITSNVSNQQASLFAINNGTGAAGVAGIANGSNGVGIYGVSNNISSQGINAVNNVGGSAFSATSTSTSSNYFSVGAFNYGSGLGLLAQNLGNYRAAEISVLNPLSTATSLYVYNNSSVGGLALEVYGKVRLANFNSGTLTVDGLGNLGVTTSLGSSILGSGTTNGVAFWSNNNTLTADGSGFTYDPSSKQLSLKSNSNGIMILANYQNSNLQAGVMQLRARGTQSAPSALQSGDQLGNFGFIGYDGTSFGNNGPQANITAVAAQNYASSVTGTSLQFSTTATNTGYSQTRMTITSEGVVNIAKLIGPGTVTVDGLGNLGVSTTSSISNLWTVVGTSLTPTTPSYGVNIGTNVTTPGLVNISSTTSTGLVVTSYNAPANNAAIWGYTYSSSTGGVGGMAFGSNSVGLYGSASDPTSTGVQAVNQAGGSALSAKSTLTTNNSSVVQIQNNGNIGTALSINLNNATASTVGLSISTSSTSSLAIQANGRVQFGNYTNGILTVDGSGNLGVTTVASGPGSGFLATSTTVQTLIGSNTWSIVQFQNKQFDDANAFNTGATNGYVVPTTGVYQINASVPFGNIGQVDIAINVAGVNVLVNSVSTSPTSGIITSVPISGVMKLYAGNQVFIDVRQFTGTNQSTASSATGANASFSIVKLY